MCCVRNESWMRTSRVYQQSNPVSYAGAICISDLGTYSKNHFCFDNTTKSNMQ